jgi:hypothetical protein
MGVYLIQDRWWQLSLITQLFLIGEQQREFLWCDFYSLQVQSFVINPYRSEKEYISKVILVVARIYLFIS